MANVELKNVSKKYDKNIVAVDKAASVPIFRPLIGYDKNEAINLVAKIGLESEANEAYKDCCSIISAHPATRANLVKVKAIEDKLKIGELARQIAGSVKLIKLN